MTLSAIVFDLDDTLYCELDYVRSGFTAVGEAVHERFDVPADVVCTHMERILAEELEQYGQARSVFDTMLAALDLPVDSETITSLVQVYRTHVPTLEPFDDVVPTLEALSARIPLGLLSDGYAGVQRAKFDSLGIERYFSAIVFTDELGTDAWKPSTAGFKAIESALDLSGSALAYVGDNPVKDFKGPKELGWVTFRIRRPGGLHLSKEASGPEYAPDYEIAALPDIERFAGN